MDAKDSNNMMHIYAIWDKVCYCIYFAVNFVDKAVTMEQYGNEFRVEHPLLVLTAWDCW